MVFIIVIMDMCIECNIIVTGRQGDTIIEQSIKEHASNDIHMLSSKLTNVTGMETRTNNDVEGYHYRINSKAQRGKWLIRELCHYFVYYLPLIFIIIFIFIASLPFELVLFCEYRE